MSPVISIIVPLYNVEKYIHNCLESIKLQDFKKFEVLIVNDGSTDSSAKICESFINKTADSRFKLYNKKNGGLGDARNFGIERCSTESQYVLFVDSDDEITPDCLSLLHSQADKEFLVSGTLYRCVEKPKDSISQTNRAVLYYDIWENPSFLEQLSKGIINSSCGKLYSLDVIRAHNIRFMKELPEDTDFNIQYLNKVTNVIQLTRPIYYYFVRQSSMSTKPCEEIFRNYIKIQEELYTKVNPKYHPMIDRFVYPQYRVNTWNYLRFKDFSTPARYLKDPMVQRAFKNYQPVSFGDKAINYLLKKRLLKFASLIPC